MTEMVVRQTPKRLRQWKQGKAIWEADTRGQPYEVQVMGIARETASETVARVLGTEQVWVRRRRYLLGGRPVQVAISFFPAHLVEGTPTTQPDTGPGGVYARLAELGHAPAYFTEEVCARRPYAKEIAALGCLPTLVVFAITRTVFTAAGTAVEVNQMTLDAESYVLRYDFDAS